MCPPDHFTIDYVINPWMAGNEGQLDKALAREQWDNLCAALSEHAEIDLIEPQAGLPDMVFTANGGFVLGDRVVPGHFIPEERRGEEVHFKKWFRDHDFDLNVLPENVGFEGAGDCLLDRDGHWLWTGYGFRTEIEAHEIIGQWFTDREVVSVKLTDSRFYHIDTCLCPLSRGYLMWHPPAFEYDSRIAVEERVPPHKRIVVDTIDAGNFACNAVNVDDDVIVHAASDALKAKLLRVGFKVHEVSLSEFLKAGGSAKCLTLKITEPAT